MEKLSEKIISLKFGANKVGAAVALILNKHNVQYIANWHKYKENRQLSIPQNIPDLGAYAASRYEYFPYV